METPADSLIDKAHPKCTTPWAVKDFLKQDGYVEGAVQLEPFTPSYR